MESCNLKTQMTNKEAGELKRIIKNKMWGMKEKLRMTFVGRYGGGHAHSLFFIVWTDLALLRCVLICLGYTTFSILFSRESGTLPVAMSAFALLLKFGES